MPPFHFQDPCGNVVQKGPVMADHQYAAFEIPQVSFQPFHHTDIQMVRGFVQQ